MIAADPVHVTAPQPITIPVKDARSLKISGWLAAGPRAVSRRDGEQAELYRTEDGLWIWAYYSREAWGSLNWKIEATEWAETLTELGAKLDWRDEFKATLMDTPYESAAFETVGEPDGGPWDFEIRRRGQKDLRVCGRVLTGMVQEGYSSHYALYNFIEVVAASGGGYLYLEWNTPEKNREPDRAGRWHAYSAVCDTPEALVDAVIQGNPQESGGNYPHYRKTAVNDGERTILEMLASADPDRFEALAYDRPRLVAPAEPESVDDEPAPPPPQKADDEIAAEMLRSAMLDEGAEPALRIQAAGWIHLSANAATVL